MSLFLVSMNCIPNSDNHHNNLESRYFSIICFTAWFHFLTFSFSYYASVLFFPTPTLKPNPFRLFINYKTAWEQIFVSFQYCNRNFHSLFWPFALFVTITLYTTAFFSASVTFFLFSFLFLCFFQISTLIIMRTIESAIHSKARIEIKNNNR